MRLSIPRASRLNSVRGVHEALITEGLYAQIEGARSEGWQIEVEPIDDLSIPQILARHIHDAAQDKIARVPSSIANRRGAQVDLANRVLRAIAEEPSDPELASLVDPEVQLLSRSAGGRRREELGHRTARPGIPLRDAACSSTGTGTCRSAPRSRSRSRVRIGSISFAHSCGSPGFGSSGTSSRSSCSAAARCG